MAVDGKPGLLNKFKQSDESVKLAVAVGAGVAAGVAGTLALQAYGKKRENDAYRSSVGGELESTPRAIALVRITPQ